MGIISSVYGNRALRPINQAAKDVVGAPDYKPAHERKIPKNEPGIVWLRVPFKEKDEAKKLGARWNAEVKFWYAKAGPNLGRFERWIKK